MPQHKSACTQLVGARVNILSDTFASLLNCVWVRIISMRAKKLAFLCGISLSCWSMAGLVSYSEGLWKMMPSVPPMQDSVKTHRKNRSRTIEINFQSSTTCELKSVTPPPPPPPSPLRLATTLRFSLSSFVVCNARMQKLINQTQTGTGNYAVATATSGYCVNETRRQVQTLAKLNPKLPLQSGRKEAVATAVASASAQVTTTTESL